MSEYPLAQGFYYGVNYGERGRKGIPANEVPAQFVPPHCCELETQSCELEIPRLRAERPVASTPTFPMPCMLHVHGQQGGFLRRLRLRGAGGHRPRRQPPHLARQEAVDLGQPRVRLCLGPQSHRHGRAAANTAPTSKSWPAFTPTTSPTSASCSPARRRRGASIWYPIQKIGPAQHANLDAASQLRARQKRQGVRTRRGRHGRAVPRRSDHALDADGKARRRFTRDLAPGKPFVEGSRTAARTSSKPTCCSASPISDGQRNHLLPAQAARQGQSSAARHRTARAGGHRQRGRTLPHRPAPGAIPPRHALPDALLARGAAPRPAGCALQQRDGPLASAPRRVRAGRDAFPQGHRAAHAPQRQPVRRRSLTTISACACVIIGPAIETRPTPRSTRRRGTRPGPPPAYHALAEIDCRRQRLGRRAGSSGPLAALQHRQPARPEPEGHRAAQAEREAEAEALLRRNLALDPLDWWARLPAAAKS